MRKIFLLLVLCCISLLSWADVAKYCMTYADFVADRWTSVDSLVQGRSLQFCQLKSKNGHYQIKTGDKEADRILKEQVFAVSYGKHLFVNCRQLHCQEASIGTRNYAHAFRYDGNKLCVTAYYKSPLPLIVEIMLDTSSYLMPIGVSVAMGVSSWSIDLATAGLGNCRCFLIDGEADAEGCYTATCMDDAYVDNLLKDDALLLQRYKAVSSKKKRQLASNILPVLMEKGLVDL